MRPCPLVPFVWLTVALAASGCVNVPAYDRGRLAQPSMSTSDLANASEAHVRAVQEGATGGSFAAGAGCGCN